MKIVIGIEVKSLELRKVSGVAKRSGKPYCFFEQTGWVDIGKPFPVEISWIVPEVTNPATGEIVQQPTPVGRYVVDESCVYVDRNRSLQINSKGMKPMAATVTPAKVG